MYLTILKEMSANWGIRVKSTLLGFVHRGIQKFWTIWMALDR